MFVITVKRYNREAKTDEFRKFEEITAKFCSHGLNKWPRNTKKETWVAFLIKI